MSFFPGHYLVKVMLDSRWLKWESRCVDTVLNKTMDESFTDGLFSSEPPDSPVGLNRGCLLDPADVIYPDLSVIVPETPR